MVGENGVGAGNLQRLHIVGSQSHGGRGLNLQVHSGPASQRDDRVITHRLRDLHGGHVQGMRQGITQGHLAFVLILIIGRLIGVAIEDKSGGLIDDS